MRCEPLSLVCYMPIIHIESLIIGDRFNFIRALRNNGQPTPLARGTYKASACQRTRPPKGGSLLPTVAVRKRARTSRFLLAAAGLRGNQGDRRSWARACGVIFFGQVLVNRARDARGDRAVNASSASQ